MTKFIKGKKLSELFFNEVVKPLIKKHYPNLKYSAGLLGHGSDVIDFDTVRSIDHDWGPRVLLFLSKEDLRKKKQISDMFSKKLPYTFKGFSTHFGAPDKKGIKVSKKINKGKIRHRIEIFSIDSFFEEYLNFNIKKISVYDWLVFPEQKLLSIVGGKVFHDDLELKKIIKKFEYFPEDVWYYLLASQWKRISQEEHFMGRCGELNDEIGSKIIATRLIKDIMKICFLMEKRYTPYIKWFGTGFNNLKSSKKLKPILNAVIKSDNWKIREKHIVKAYEYIAKLHNSLKITKPLKTKVDYFHDRPFLVINGELFASEIKKQIKDPILKSIKLDIGSINQFSDSTDIFEMDTQKFKSVYK
tara:strand:+ start:1001 stop:2074 length:1074 start_codon:yes stop_codon:yes gene_type:complete